MEKDKNFLDEVFDLNKPPTVKEILKQVVAGQSEISKKLTEIENNQQEHLARLEKLERFYVKADKWGKWFLTAISALLTYFVTGVKEWITNHWNKVF